MRAGPFLRWTGFLAAMLASSAGARAESSRFEFKQPHMGTLFRIVLYAESRTAAETAAQAAFSRIAELDRTLSDYRDDSELSRVLRAPTHLPVEVSADLASAISASLRMHELSGGAFDITLGPLGRLWREARKQGLLPSRDSIEAARSRSGIGNLSLAGRKLTLRRPGLGLDFGGIGKGLAVEEAYRKLRSLGFERCMVQGSGDIRVGRAPPGARGWKIGVSEPETAAGVARRFVLLENRAISTSGDGVQFVEIGGKRYSHVLDPRTGYGLTHGRWVTVVAEDGATADAVATAASIVPEAGIGKLQARFRQVAIRSIGASNETRVFGRFPVVRTMKEENSP